MALLQTIDNFTGSYRREGLNIVKLQGKQYLTSGFKTEEYRSSTNDIADLGVIKDFDSIVFSEAGSQLTGIDNKGQIVLSATIYGDDMGIINEISGSPGDIDLQRLEQNPGIITTTNNNIFYTSACHLGVGYLFKATSATSTSLTVTGETFNATYGINHIHYRSHIYNITKGEAYENTKVSPTDTLEFSTADTTPEADDYFYVFVDNAFDFNTNLDKGNQFSSQTSPSHWARPIVLSDDYYYILNGNYISRIDVSDNDADNATFDTTWQPLLNGRQALCFDLNVVRLLVGAEFKGKYELLLIDTNGFGITTSVSLPAEPSSIISYESGWLVMAGGTLYYSDGYQLREISTMPDFEDSDSDLTMVVSGMNYKKDNVFIMTNSQSDRYGGGLFIYNFNYGWNFTSLSNDSISCRKEIQIGAITKYEDKIYCGYSLNDDSDYVIGEILESIEDVKKLGLLIHFDGQTKISQIGLTLSEIYDYVLPGLFSAKTTNITISYANARKALHQPDIQVGENNTTTSIKFPWGTTYNSEVGQKILFTDGNVAGESTYITDIADKETMSEVWTVSPALSFSPDDESGIIKYNLYKSGTKTISTTNIPQDVRFSTNFIGDILYLEVELENAYLDISNIRLYG